MLSSERFAIRPSAETGAGAFAGAGIQGAAGIGVVASAAPLALAFLSQDWRAASPAGHEHPKIAPARQLRLLPLLAVQLGTGPTVVMTRVLAAQPGLGYRTTNHNSIDQMTRVNPANGGASGPHPAREPDPV